MASSRKPFLKFILLLVVLAVGYAGYFYYQRSKQKGAVPQYQTTTVAKGEITQVITATGQLDAVLTVEVGSQISGLIKEIFVDFNSTVKKGQVLVEIDPATYQQKLRQAEASAASAQASFNLAELNAKRTADLIAKSLVTQQESDQVQAQLQQSKAQLLTAQASVENARVDLSRCTIYSPIDGTVISKQTEVGKTVAASLNVPTLFTIANDLAKMQITAAVAEADIGAVAVGQAVNFQADAFPNRRFTGTVTQVRNAPKTVSNVVTYDTIISVDNKDLKLRPGMTANVDIVVAVRTSTLRVPNAALRVRMPESLLPAKKTAAAATGSVPTATANAGARPAGGGQREGGARRSSGGGFGANLTPEQRQKISEIRTQLGITGQPTPEQREQMRKLLAEAGITAGESGDEAIVTRTVYRLPGGNVLAQPEAVSVKVGITDSLTSEIISGLAEGDVLITSVVMPAGSGAAPAASSSPFGSSGQRRF